MNVRDTIVAISTPPGRGGLEWCDSLVTKPEIAGRILRFPQRAALAVVASELAELVDCRRRLIDQVVVSYFEAPTFLHRRRCNRNLLPWSARCARTCVERACCKARELAEPGEFTLRAYLNGRIDLPQAEAVRELIEATTLYQARVAAQQMRSVSRRIRRSRSSCSN